MKLTFKKAVIIILTVTSCYSSAYAWIPPWKRDIFNFCKATVDRKNFTDSIPFEFINNRIIIPVIIEGDTLRYIFDTGASMTITDETLFAKNCTVRGLLNVSDANGKMAKIKAAEIKSMKLGNINFTDTRCTVMNLPEEVVCSGFAGLIGPNIMKGMTVKIDMENHCLILSDKTDFIENEDITHSASMLASKNQNIPYITGSYFGIKDRAIQFDSGDPGMFDVSHAVVKTFIKKFKPHIIDETQGVASSGFTGFENDTLKYLFQCDSLTFAGLRFHNIYAHTTYSRNSRVGAELLNYGNVILDFKKSRFIFQPTKKDSAEIQVTEPKPEYSLTPAYKGALVSLIWEKSPAYSAGLRKGFIIRSINGFIINDYCDLNTPELTKEKKNSKNRRLLVTDLEGNEREIVYERE